MFCFVSSAVVVVVKNVTKLQVDVLSTFASISHVVVISVGFAVLRCWSVRCVVVHLGFFPSPLLFFSTCFVLSPACVLVTDGLAVDVRPCEHTTRLSQKILPQFDRNYL